MTIAQGAVFTDTTEPIRTSAGVLVADGLSAGPPTITLAELVDSADVDQSAGAALTYAGRGKYRVTKTIPGGALVGNWRATISYLETGFTVPRDYTLSFQVVTSQQADPMASVRGANLDRLDAIVSTRLAAADYTATAGQLSDPISSYTTPGTIGYAIAALFARPIVVNDE